MSKLAILEYYDHFIIGARCGLTYHKLQQNHVENQATRSSLRCITITKIQILALKSMDCVNIKVLLRCESLQMLRTLMCPLYGFVSFVIVGK